MVNGCNVATNNIMIQDFQGNNQFTFTSEQFEFAKGIAALLEGCDEKIRAINIIRAELDIVSLKEAKILAEAAMESIEGFW